ncbi:CHIT1-like protein, partial [Mya arenaria]
MLYTPVPRELDYVSVMTYDLHGSWETTVGHHSPLRSSDNLNMVRVHTQNGYLNIHRTLFQKSVAEYWVSKGMSKEKLVIGLPLYGRTFQMASPYLTAPGSGAVGPGSPGKYTDEPGFLAYYEVCELLSSEQADFRRHWLQQADVPYMEDGQDWVGYDDPDSITAKVAWLIGEGYAGAMVWTLDMDDFRGACPLSRAPYPMINRIHRLLKGENGTVGQTCREDGVMGYPCDDVSATCSAETNVCVCSSPTVSDGLQCLKRKYPGEPCDIQTDVCVNDSSCDFISAECKCRYEFYLDGNNCVPNALPPDVGSSTDALPHDLGPSTDALPPKVWSSTDAALADVGLSTDAPPTNVGFKDLQISVDTGATTASEEREEWDRPPDTDANGDVGASNDADMNAETLTGTPNLATANENTLNSMNVLMIDKHMLQKIRDEKSSDSKTDLFPINHLTKPKEFHIELEDTVQEIKPGVPENMHTDVVDTASDDDDDDKDSLKGPVAVCYYSSWSSDRHGKARFLPEDIDPTLCTHLVYAFANIDTNFQLTMTNSYADEEMCASFNGLKARNPEVKTLLAVGGWEFGSWVFSQLASSEENRKNFTTSCVDLLPTWGFDGLDVDWEYPVLRGGGLADKENFVTLLQELRTTFKDEAKRSGNPRMLLSVAVAAGKETVDTAYDVRGIAKHVDFISIMTYDLHGSWDPVTGYNAPLFPRSEDGFMDRTLTVQWAANYWVDQGAPKSKLVVGLAAYGRTFTLLLPNNWNIGSSVIGAGVSGEYTREPGFLTYFE